MLIFLSLSRSLILVLCNFHNKADFLALSSEEQQLIELAQQQQQPKVKSRVGAYHQVDGATGTCALKLYNKITKWNEQHAHRVHSRAGTVVVSQRRNRTGEKKNEKKSDRENEAPYLMMMIMFIHSSALAVVCLRFAAAVAAHNNSVLVRSSTTSCMRSMKRRDMCHKRRVVCGELNGDDDKFSWFHSLFSDSQAYTTFIMFLARFALFLAPLLPLVN